jgi:hypothetical protein
MPGEVIRWLNTSPHDRQRSREIATVHEMTNLAVTQVGGINEVTRHAMYETMLTNTLRQRAEQIAPDASGSYQLIATVGAIESAKVIEDMSRRYRYGR